MVVAASHNVDFFRLGNSRNCNIGFKIPGLALKVPKLSQSSYSGCSLK